MYRLCPHTTRRTGFSREEAGTFAVIAWSDRPPSRLKPVLQNVFDEGRRLYYGADHLL
jgi:hypothetical protein